MPGLPARLAAIAVVHRVLAEGRASDGGDIDEADALDGRDRAFARAISVATLRRAGTLRAVLDGRLARGLPSRCGTLEAVLLTAAAQILLLDVPVHAVVNLAVQAAREDAHARHFAPLVNAVLRGVAAGGLPASVANDVRLDTPPWLFERWTAAYGAAEAASIARMHRVEPPLDLTARGDAARLAGTLGATLLPTGSLRLLSHGPVTDLPGFDAGEWWVQDAAAAVPARLLEARDGEHVADLCAAPGGKTLQLAATGAAVTAVDRSQVRLRLLAENLRRTGLSAEIVAADVLAFEAATPFDAVLLDAPCSATGTIRRHPDVAWLKGGGDLRALANLQADLLDAAVRLLRPGGRLVYSVCSLEGEEGEAQIEPLLARHPELRLDRIAADRGLEGLVTPSGTVRALPTHWPDADERRAGLDGFFIARFRKR